MMIMEDVRALADWLLQQIAEDEQVANYANLWWKREEEFKTSSLYTRSIPGDPHGATPHLIVKPARALADCAAKRSLVKWALGIEHLCQAGAQDAPTHPLGLEVLQMLATVYVDREGYREEWRPEQ